MENCILKLYFLALDLENIAGEGGHLDYQEDGR